MKNLSLPNLLSKSSIKHCLLNSVPGRLLESFMLLLFLTMAPFSKMNAQLCSGSSPVTYATCNSSYNLGSPANANCTYLWYECDAGGGNLNALTGGNSITVYPNSSTGNQTNYYVYLENCTSPVGSCYSAVITVQWDYDLEIVSDYASPPTYSVYPYSSITYSNYKWYSGTSLMSTAASYSPTISGSYNLEADPSCGGTRSSINAFTYNAPNAQCSTTPAGYITCSTTYTLTFTPSAGYSVDWYECDQYGASGSFLNTGTSSIVSPSSTVGQYFYYYYVCTDNFSLATCTSAVITVEYDLNLNIHIASGTTLPATLLAYSSGQSYSNYQWYRNGQAIIGGTSSSYPATLPGDYYMTCLSSCGVSTSNTITFCGTVTAPYSNYTFASGTTTTLASSTIVFDGTITIDSNAILNINNCDVYMTAGSEIIVKKGALGGLGGSPTNGGILQISNTIISSCGKWGGIYAEGFGGTYADNDQSATVKLKDNSEIHDAYIGLFANNNAKLDVDSTLFENNYQHIDLRNFGGWKSGCGGGVGNYGVNLDFSHNTFNYLMETVPSFFPTLLPTAPNNSSYRKQIYIDYGRTIKLSHSTFNCYNWSTQDQNAVEVRNVYGELCNIKGFTVDHCTFNGDYNDAMLFTAADDFAIIYNDVSGDVNHGIEIQGGNNAEITNNTIYNTSTPYGGISGVIISQVSYLTYVDNDVRHFVKGLEYYNYGNSVVGNISDNTFEHNQYGIVVAPECDPTATTLACTNSTNYTNLRALTMACNHIYHCDWGIVGVGKIIDQGSLAGTDWGNFFGDCSTWSGGTPNICTAYTSTTSNADIAWYNTSNIGIYFYPGLSCNANSYSIDLDNHTVDGSFSHPNYAVVANAANGYGCFSSFKTDPYTGIGKQPLEETLPEAIVKVFPNPNNGSFFVQNLSKSLFNYRVYNTIGQLVYQGSVYAGNTEPININANPVGFYNVVLEPIDSDGKRQVFKIIKTNE